MKNIIRVTIAVLLCVSVLAVVAISNSTLISVGDNNIDISDVDSTKENYDFAKRIGVDTDIPSDKEALKYNVKRSILEKKFIENNIELTNEERSYSRDYLSTQIAVLDEMIERGGSERENAHQVMEIIEQYIDYKNISLDEYSLLVEEEIAFQLKYNKLVSEKYNGDISTLEDEIETEISTEYMN